MEAEFADRAEAGERLAAVLAAQHWVDPVVIALPRGGVPVAARVAAALHAPLELLLVRKIGAPGQRELAVAALVDGDPPELVFDHAVMAASGATVAYVEREALEAQRENERRRRVYQPGRAPLPLAGRTVLLVDDGIATGTTVRAALRALRRRGPVRLVLAVPVAPRGTVAALRGEVDELVCLAQPRDFQAVGAHYGDFEQVDDAQVVAALAAAGAT